MPRVRVQLADGSFKHVNMTREELVRYNTTGELSGDVVNQDNLLLKVLNKNGVFNDAKVSTIEDVDGDLKDFVGALFAKDIEIFDYQFETPSGGRAV